MQDGLTMGKRQAVTSAIWKGVFAVKENDVSGGRRPNRDHRCNNDHGGNKDVLPQSIKIETTY